MCLLPKYEQVALTDITNQLQGADLFNKPGILQTVWVLHSMIDKGQTVTIDGAQHKRGATCPVAQETIADLIGVKRRATAHNYLKELIDAGVIRVEKASIGGKNCYRYIFTIFDLYAEEAKTCTDDDDSTDENTPENEEPVRSDDETCTLQGVHNQEVQDLGPTVSSYPGPNEENEESEKRGGDHRDNEEQEQEKASLREEEGVDIVPTAEIGKAKEVDVLVEAILGVNQSNMKPPEDGIEPFIDSFNKAFNLESVAVLSQGYVGPALELQKAISSKLSAAGLALPVDRFLEKYLAPCVKESLDDGLLDEPPRAFGFFLRKPLGKKVLDRSIVSAKSSNGVKQSVERTDTFLDNLKGREPPSESAKERVSGLVSDIKPMTPEEAKEFRRKRRAS